MRRLAVLILLALPLAACGPKTVISGLFPTRYGATSVVEFEDGGRTVRQTVVSRCRTVDQSDSIAANISTQVTGERHWIRRADGSLWVLGLLDVCRWGVDGPRRKEGFRPVEPNPPREARDRVFRLGDSLTYRYNDPAKPLLLDTWRTADLFEHGADGLKVRSAVIAPGGEHPSDTLSAAFPALAGEARLSFMGLSAEALQLSGGRCPAPDANAEGPIRLPGDAECQFANACRPERKTLGPCKTRLGGLLPRISDDYRKIDFALERRERAYVGSLVETSALRASGAPGFSPNQTQDWLPELCLDGACAGIGRFEFPLFYYPRRNVLVQVRHRRHGVWPSLVLARKAPGMGRRGIAETRRAPPRERTTPADFDIRRL